MSTDGAAFELTGSRLRLGGALVFATAAAAWREGVALIDASAPSVLDLTGVTRSDSAGLALVLALLARGRRACPGFQVVQAPEAMRALARVSDVDGWLEPPAPDRQNA